MKNYETIFIIRQEATTPQVDNIADEMAAIVKDNGGEFSRREYWGLRTLAYRIRKSRKGHYILFNYSAESTVVDALQYKMRYSEDILRYMTIKTEELPSDASVQMRKSEEESEASSRPQRRDEGYRPRPANTSTSDDENEDEGEEFDTDAIIDEPIEPINEPTPSDSEEE